MTMRTMRAAITHLAVAGALVVAVPCAIAKTPRAAHHSAHAAKKVRTHKVHDRAHDRAHDQAMQGKVTYYALRDKGRRTASGERYDPSELTMAHRSLPFGSLVRVTNLRNQRSVVVRVNDRGPFVRGYVADLSLAAARELNMLHLGVVPAELELASGARLTQTDPAPSADALVSSAITTASTATGIAGTTGPTSTTVLADAPAQPAPSGVSQR